MAAIQIQKGDASGLDGPGAMGGAINLVTLTPRAPFEAEGGVSVGGRGFEGWNGYSRNATAPLLRAGSVALSDWNSWSLSGDYPAAARFPAASGRASRLRHPGLRTNVKVGVTPNSTDEYTVNYTRQSGEKGAPLNVYNNPPVPPNSFWRWPCWTFRTHHS